MANAHSLPLLLKQLWLPTMYRSWEEYAKIAQTDHWDYPTYLAKLCELEVATRSQKRIQRHLCEAKLPAGKTLATFDFAAAKSINAAQITALAENTDWVKQANNLIIFGPSGVGKTHLAAAISSSLIARGIRALFTTTTALVQQLMQAYNAHKLTEMLTKLARYQLLILDDIGYIKKAEAETSVLFELIADRYETRSLIITANQPFGEWDKIFPDSVTAVAAIDRLVHHATVINIAETDSYRKKNRGGVVL